MITYGAVRGYFYAVLKSFAFLVFPWSLGALGLAIVIYLIIR